MTLARLLADRGLRAKPEIIGPNNQRPDVFIDLGWVRLVLEGRRAAYRQALFHDAKARVNEDVADIAIAVLYGDELYTQHDPSRLEAALKAANFSGAIFYPHRGCVEARDFEHHSINDLVVLINEALDAYVQNDVVREQVQALEAAIEEVVQRARRDGLFFRSEILVAKLQDALGVTGGTDAQEDDESSAE